MKGHHRMVRRRRPAGGAPPLTRPVPAARGVHDLAFLVFNQALLASPAFGADLAPFVRRRRSVTQVAHARLPGRHVIDLGGSSPTSVRRRMVSRADASGGAFATALGQWP